MTNTEAVQTVTIIYTDRGAQIVHAAGCGDIARDSLKGRYNTEDVEAGSLADVAAVAYQDFLDEGPAEDFIQDLTVKPCVHLAPTAATFQPDTPTCPGPEECTAARIGLTHRHEPDGSISAGGTGAPATGVR